MKKNFTFYLSTFLLFTFNYSISQCNLNTIQNNTSFDQVSTLNNNSEKFIGQTFKAPNTVGYFSEVRLKLRSVTPSTTRYSIEIYEGVGNTGNLIASTPINITTSNSNLTYLFTGPQTPYIPGATYSLYLHGIADGSSFRIGVAVSLDTYSDGILSFVGSNDDFSSLDTDFSVQATTLSTPPNLTTTNITGTDATLTWDSVTNATSYDWKVEDSSNTIVDSGTGITTNTAMATGLTANTSYNAYVRVNAECGGTSLTSAWSPVIPFSTNTLSIDDNDTSTINLNVFPNPSSDIIKIETSEGQSFKYTIYNIVGAKISEGTTQSNYEINIRNYKDGLYLLRLENGKTLKFIKN